MLGLTGAALRFETELPPLLHAELLQQQARGAAMLGAELAELRRRLDRAFALAETTAGGYCPVLRGIQTAVCLTEAGRPGQAVRAYQVALAEPVASARDRAYFEVLMAGALALSGEPDQAAELGRAALPTAVSHGSRRAVVEATTVMANLRPWRDRPAVRDLDEGLRTALSAVGTS